MRTHFPDLIEQAVTDLPISSYTADVPDGAGLWIADHNYVDVLILGESGVCELLGSETDAALRWAEDQYEQVKQNAGPVFFRGQPQTTSQ